jgi:hypothetical protein
MHTSSDGVMRRRAAPLIERPKCAPRAAQAEACQRELAGLKGGLCAELELSVNLRDAAQVACLLLRYCSYSNRFPYAVDAFEGDYRCCRVLLDKVNQRCACSLALRVHELCTCMLHAAWAARRLC